jgi:hypothetical protein
MNITVLPPDTCKMSKGTNLAELSDFHHCASEGCRSNGCQYVINISSINFIEIIFVTQTPTSKKTRCISFMKTNMAVLFTNVLCVLSERRNIEIIYFNFNTVHFG